MISLRRSGIADTVCQSGLSTFLASTLSLWDLYTLDPLQAVLANVGKITTKFRLLDFCHSATMLSVLLSQGRSLLHVQAISTGNVGK